jgi:hypothetical protein
VIQPGVTVGYFNSFTFECLQFNELGNPDD